MEQIPRRRPLRPLRPPLSAKYTITVMRDELCNHPQSYTSRRNIGVSTYHGKSNPWLREMGYQRDVYFPNGNLTPPCLRTPILHKILLWTFLVLEPSKQYITGLVKQGDWDHLSCDWDHLSLHREASDSKCVVLELQFQEE